jgi:uncharacterized protein (DUF2267 family)
MIDERHTALRLTLRELDLWLNELSEIMGGVSRPIAHRALQGVLTAVREGLPAAAAAHMGERLPHAILGMYHQGLPAREGRPPSSHREFLTHVRDELRSRCTSDAELTIRAVFELLERRLGTAVFGEVIAWLPEEIQELHRPVATA